MEIQPTLRCESEDLILPVGALPVLWDINKCPLTDACDARRLGQWIEGVLRDLGYTCPIAITAFGRLLRVPYKVLRAASHSGITLYEAPYGRRDIDSLLLFTLSSRKPPPNKVMLISPPQRFAFFLTEKMKSIGLDIIFPFPSDCDKADAKIFLQNALQTGSDDEDALNECSEALWDPKDGPCAETAIWVCGVCSNLTGRGFKNYTNHVNDGKHEKLLFLYQQQKMGFPTNMSIDDVKRLKRS